MATGRVTNITDAGKGAPFRSAPDASTTSNILGVLEPDTEVTLFGYENGWYYAECEGVQGYVAGEFIQALDGIGSLAKNLTKIKSNLSKDRLLASKTMNRAAGLEEYRQGVTITDKTAKKSSSKFKTALQKAKMNSKTNSNKPVKTVKKNNVRTVNSKPALICPACGAMYSITALNGLGETALNSGVFVCPRCGQKYTLNKAVADAVNAQEAAEKIQEAAATAAVAAEQAKEAVETAPATAVQGLGSLKSFVNKVATKVSDVASKLTNTAEKATAVSAALNNSTSATTTATQAVTPAPVVQQPATQPNNTDMDEAKKATIKKVAIIGGIAVGLGTIAIIAVKKSKKNSAAPAPSGKLNGIGRKHRRGKHGKKSSCKVINLK